MKNQYTKRVAIYPQDIEVIMGKSERSARRLLQRIKKNLGKTDEQYVTIREFCVHMGFKEEEIRLLLSG